MQILRDGKEVKNATVIHDVTGRRTRVRVDGVMYDVKAFEFVDGNAKEIVKDEQPVQEDKELNVDAGLVEPTGDPEDTAADSSSHEPKHKTLFGRKKK